MRRVVRVLLAMVLALTAPALVPSTAHAADDPQVSITIDALDPALPDRSSTIVIRGRVTNTTGEPLTRAQVLFWRDWSPITSPDGFREALASEPTQPYGGRVTDQDAFQTLGTGESGQVAPGETVPFQVSAPVSALELPRTAGTYLMGVHVVGQAGRRGNATLGRARTFVPLGRQATGSAPATNPDPISVPTVVILTSRPSLVRPGVFSDDHLAGELAPDGRLTRLLRSASRNDVAYAIDPALLQAVRTMANPGGYQVRGADGRTTEGEGTDAAARWLADFTRLPAGRGFRLPFAIPDLTPVAHQALEDTFGRIVAASGQVTELNALPLLAYANGSFLDGQTVQWYERMSPAAVLAANAPTSQALLARPGGAPLVSFDPSTYAGGPGPDPRATAVQQRQRVLADTWVAASTGSAPRVHVVTTAEEADVDQAASAPWIARRPLTELLLTKPVAWGDELAYTPQMRDAELTRQQVGRLRELLRAEAAYAEMLPDPGPRQRETDALVARSASSWWRANPAGYAAWIDPLVADANRVLAGADVSLTAQKTVIMSGQTGSFPVTVTNRLDHAVRVAIDFDSDQPQRLSITRYEGLEVPAKQSVTVNVRGRAAANGPVMVTAQLVTPGGTPIGRRSRVEVSATNFGFVGWIIVVASAIVLLAATALRIRQVRRERVSTTTARRAADGDTPVGRDGTPPVVTIDRREPTEGGGE